MGRSRDRSRRRRSRSHDRSLIGRRREASPILRSRHESPSSSRSRSPRRRSKFRRFRSFSRSRSHSPNRRRPGYSSYESPPENECLGIFNLNPVTSDRQIESLFSQYGRIRDVNIIYDRFSGRSRGFGFVYYDRISDARLARDQCNGLTVDGRRIRVDFSATQRPHTPTPGKYMGKPSYGGGGVQDDERWGFGRSFR